MELLSAIERTRWGMGKEGELTIQNSGEGKYPWKGVTFE